MNVLDKLAKLKAAAEGEARISNYDNQENMMKLTSRTGRRKAARAPC
jgi:hypothetical protein